MKPWTERPAEIANLLNPAFCGEIIRRTAIKYQDEKGSSFPFLFAFLILPLLTNRAVRETIPTRGSPRINDWIVEHSEVRIGLPSRIEQLAPITKEAVGFLASHNCIRFDSEGNIEVLFKKRPSILNHDQTRHPHNFYKKAEKLGQWFAGSGGPSVVFASLGVRL